jgi:predicted glycosyltransferase
MAFAFLIISDSQSMSVEASLLGVPSIRFNDFAGKISVLEELEHKYRLTYGIPSSDPQGLLMKVDEFMKDKNLKKNFVERKNCMLKEKINTLDFMVWYLDSFPQSMNEPGIAWSTLESGNK